MSNKPREFFIQFSDLCYDDWDTKVTVEEGTDANVYPDEKIKVIEKSAYDKLKAEKKALVEALHMARGKMTLDYHGGKVLKADFEDVEPILRNALKQAGEDDPDRGSSMCIHGDTSPMTCELCRGEES